MKVKSIFDVLEGKVVVINDVPHIKATAINVSVRKYNSFVHAVTEAGDKIPLASFGSMGCNDTLTINLDSYIPVLIN